MSIESVIVYTRPACAACESTKGYLTRGGVEFDTIDVSRDYDAGMMLVDKGFRAMPVVEVRFADGTEDWWAGTNTDKMDSIIAGVAE